MRIAFYAPLKPPDHPVPSGDRRVARPAARCACASPGIEPFVASRLRSYDGHGDPARQARLAGIGAAASPGGCSGAGGATRRPRPICGSPITSITRRRTGSGRRSARRSAFPMSSPRRRSAPKRVGGAWDIGQRAVERALRRADAVLGLNPADRDCVLPLLRDPERWIAFPPFLDARSYAAAPRPHPSAIAPPDRGGDDAAGRQARLLSPARRRARDAVRSRLVARYCRRRRSARRGRGGAGRRSARGSAGAARSTRRQWPPLSPRPTCLSGRRSTRRSAWRCSKRRRAGCRSWPGRAAASCGIVADGKTGLLVPPGDPVAFAAALRPLIRDSGRRAAMGAAARARVRREHDLPAAAMRLRAILAGLRQKRAA